ncbi:uncharacterized protein LOC129595963 [Paramacrobiotus metropolitanus]|uniref:uncharacterized protein LOC129595963 n=1 Tax=Paramacrobiotus metropolitanus TaxID=2943436 RepID=UPI0024458E74|nr:uncharacterized protein LOC129595963 [Paramacrobiotus metropolitanus]
MIPLRVPQNSLPFVKNLRTETREQYTNTFYLNYFEEFVRKDDKSVHPLLAPSSQHHHGPNDYNTRDVCVLVSPHGAEQEAEHLPAWIHESKAGRVLVKNPASPAANMLFYESRRRSIGEQLFQRFINSDMLKQMDDYDWTALFGSSGVGPLCSIWQLDFDKRAVYRIVSSDVQGPKRKLLKKLSDANPKSFPTRYWNLQVDDEMLENIVGFGQTKVLAGVDELGLLEVGYKNGLNVRQQPPHQHQQPQVAVAGGGVQMADVDDSDHESVQPEDDTDSDYVPSETETEEEEF